MGIVFHLLQEDNPMAMFRSLARSFRKFNSWLVGWTGVSSKWVVGLEIGLLLTVGGIMLELELYALAVAAWVTVGIIVVAKTCELQKPSRLLRILSTIATMIVCTLFITATDMKRGDRGWWFPKRCAVAVNVTSRILTRAHLRAKWIPSRHETEVYKPLFQDLFHEWVIIVTPNRDTSSVVVSIVDARKPVDNIRVIPATGVTISEPKPGWASGFEEPTQAPDFFTRTVTFPALTLPETITIRRPIKSHFGSNALTSLDLDLDRQITASAEECLITVAPRSALPRPLSDNPRFGELIQEFRALLIQHVTGGPITTRPDPDEPYPPLEVSESELVEEAVCANSACTQLTITMKEKTRVH
jgi:hypothetical protein